MRKQLDKLQGNLQKIHVKKCQDKVLFKLFYNYMY